MENINIEMLQNDSDFMSRLAAADDAKAIKDLLSEKGIDITEEEAAEGLSRALDSSELDETDLDSVSGGFGVATVAGGVLLVCFLVGAARGMGSCH